MAFAEEDRIWHKRGWIAEIIPNEDDDGWAVSMTREGDDEPVFIAPWTMGRNKKDPKPLNEKDFLTWVKSAREFLERSTFQKRTANRRSFDVTSEAGDRLTVVFDVTRDDFEPRGVLTALDSIGQEVARAETSADYTLTLEGAEDWVNSDFAPPREEEVFREVVYEEEVFEPEHDEY
jgi:hypothetical protein